MNAEDGEFAWSMVVLGTIALLYIALAASIARDRREERAAAGRIQGVSLEDWCEIEKAAELPPGTLRDPGPVLYVPVVPGPDRDEHFIVWHGRAVHRVCLAAHLRDTPIPCTRECAAWAAMNERTAA